MNVQKADVIVIGGGHEPVDMENRRAYVNPRRTLIKLAQAPRVGDVMAELIHTGATTTPIECYHIGRFAKLVAHAA
jgi:hypothetical protein